MGHPGSTPDIPPQLGTGRWFGESWGAMVCHPLTHIDTPVGEFCGRCEQPILAGQQGLKHPATNNLTRQELIVSLHLQCWLDEIGNAPGVNRAYFSG